MIRVQNYLGKRWAVDFNCWDFVRLIYQEEFGIELCRHGINDSRNIREACKAVGAETANPVWVETASAEENGIVLLGRGGVRWHVGLILSQSKILHLIDNGPSTVHDFSALKKSFQNFTFFQHAHFR